MFCELAFFLWIVWNGSFGHCDFTKCDHHEALDLVTRQEYTFTDIHLENQTSIAVS